MASSINIRCPYCKDDGRVVRDGRPRMPRMFDALEGPRYWCRRCDNAWVVSATRRVAAKNQPGLKGMEAGFIPWASLPPGAEKVYVDADSRLRRGKGPGSSFGRATKLLGLKPCRGCRDRIAVLDNLGWMPVLMYTGAVAGALAGCAFMVQWLVR